MPDPTKIGLTTPIVYWEVDAVDAYGEATYKDPVQLYGRWIDEDHDIKKQLGVIDATATLSRVVIVGSVFWKGLLANVPNPTITPDFPRTVLFKVIDFQETPDVKGRSPYREAFLQRLGARIPE